MQRKLTLYILSIGLQFVLLAQPNIEEKVFVHINSQTLITGETLRYSAFCTSALTNQPSSLSKILYVELIGEKGTIHQAKIELINGRGDGEFFLSSLITTGKFQLVAYTRWMRNFEEYFQTPVTIINPYEAYKADMISSEKVPLEIRFFPACEKIVANIENTVAFKVSGLAKTESIKGKIVGSDGETVLTFTPDVFGLGQFDFTPKAGLKYEAILEDENRNLSFHSLPKIESTGTTLVLNETDTHLEVTINTWPEERNYGYLWVTGDFSPLKYNAELNSTILIPKADIGKGIVHLKLQGLNNAIIAERTYSRDFEQLKKDKLGASYQPRQEVIIAPKLGAGNYSVSVRKKPDYVASSHDHLLVYNTQRMVAQTQVDPNQYFGANDSKANSETFWLTAALKTRNSAQSKITLMPEVREELLSGRVLKNDGSSAANSMVVFSAPESPYHIRSAETDENGLFTLPYESGDKAFFAYMCVWPVSSEYTILVNNQFLDNDPDFDYSITPLDSNQVKEIVARSIRNQIENAYYEGQKDTTMRNNWLPQFPFDSKYILDEYTRFRTIKETFTEFILGASVREGRSPIFKAFYEYSGAQDNYPPLLLLDGVLVSDQKLVDYSPYKVESISVLSKRYFLGSLIADGVLSLETKEGNMDQFPLEDDYTKIELLGLSKSIENSSSNQDPNMSPTKPDQRDQLLWLPNFEVTPSSSAAIKFFTSDVLGTFEMVIEGYTLGGQPVSIIREFEVK